MKKRLLGLFLGVMLISVCVGCGAESTTTEPTETATETTSEESTTEQTEEATATPEETVEPTPEANIEAVEEATTKPETTEPTETAEPEQTEAPTPEPVPQYTYTDMSTTMYAQQTVNVRDLPDTSGNKIGSLSTNDEITISAKCNETGWYQFEYNGSVAFVSNKYIGENKVEVQAPANNSGSSGGQASSNTATECPYSLNQVIDEGGDKVYYYYTQSNNSTNTYVECASIIASRHGWYIDVLNGGTAGFGGAGEPEKTNYTYNGEVVYRARPCTYLIGPNGGGPKSALEVVICP